MNKINNIEKTITSQFDDWDEVKSALVAEIIASQERKSEVSIFDGKRMKGGDETIYYYRFSITDNENLDPSNICEIRYKDDVITDSSVIRYSDQKVTIAIPKSFDPPLRIPVLILVNDPSFILQKLLEAIENIQKNDLSKLGLLNTVFGPKEGIKDKYPEFDNVPIVSTFNYNELQEEAITKSKTNKILFLWGPPGTGKTTILGKIISDFVKNDETVLLCSNTNRAVDVSVLKTVQVSNNETTPIKKKSLRWGNIHLTEENDLKYVTLESHRIRREKEKREKIKEEYELLDSYNRKYRDLNEVKNKLKPLILASRRLEELKSKSSFNDFHKQEIERLENKVQIQESSIVPLKIEIAVIQKDIKVIEDVILEKFESVQKLREFVFEATLVTTEEILADIRFHSATFAKTVIDDQITIHKYDNIVIDEASMANLPYLIFLSTFAKKRMIFVGDPQQLAPIVISSGINSNKWLKRDIFLATASAKHVTELFNWQSNNSDISVLLTNQYRMPKKIFCVVNELFYNGRLVNKTETEGSIKIIDTSKIDPVLNFPSSAIKSPVNVSHSELIISDITEAIADKENKVAAAKAIGVMTPFTQHKRFLQYLTKVRYIPGSIEVGVIHTFQGREKPRIYLDLTLSNIDYTYPTFDEHKTSITEVSRLLNVAISRCQSSKKDFYDGEFVLVANINYFKSYHRNGLVYRFIKELIINADEIISVDDEINPFNLISEKPEQVDIFEKEAERAESEEMEGLVEVEEFPPVVDDVPKDEIVADNKIKKEIEKYCEIITQEIQWINHKNKKTNNKDLFMYTSAINGVLTDLPITYCNDLDSFKLFIDMMYKLIYESSGGLNAKYPVRDPKAKYGVESYGKIRLVIHQLRQLYFHDIETFEAESQRKIKGHVEEFFNNTISKSEPEDKDEWTNCQLSILFKSTEYLKEINKRIS